MCNTIKPTNHKLNSHKSFHILSQQRKSITLVFWKAYQEPKGPGLQIYDYRRINKTKVNCGKVRKLHYNKEQ